MDSLIRLDVLMPVAPLTENNIHRTTDDSILNQNPQQTVVNTTAIDLEEVPDLIDLTTHQGERLSPNHDNDIATRPIPLRPTYPPVVIIDEDNAGDAGPNHRSSTKHKLPPLSNHSPSKVSRTDCKSSFLAIVDSNGNCHSSFRPTSNQERSNPNIPPSTITKDYTVTSVNNGLQSGLNMAGTSDEINLFRPSSSRQIAHANILEPFLAGKGPNHFQNDVFPHNFHQDILKEKQVQTKLTQHESVQINSDAGVRGNKVKESLMFFQLLDMFPDIDLKFLENQCRLGLDINQVSEIILELNDYPKFNFKPSVRPTITPKLVVNVNLNNFNIPTSCSSSTTHILRDERKLVSEDNRNDNFSLSAASLSTSLVVPIPNNFKHEISTTQNAGNGKDYNESDPTSSNSQKTNKEALVEKHLPNELVGKEKNNLLDKSDCTNSVQSQFGFLMEIFPDADPTFMEIKSKLKDNDLRNFIAESMEKHDYPKVAASVKYENEVEDESIEIGLYTTNFNLENFIKIFPDPFGYFRDEKRNCQYTEHGFGFLKRRYRCHAIKLIALKYKEFKYNLVKTCEFLDAEKPSRVTKRGINEIKMPEGTNLPFLQEACFIEHKIEIKKYIEGVAEAKRLAYEQAESRKELIECGCCYQNGLFEDCATCNEGHLFCKTCVRKSVEVRIGDGYTTFPCLQECDSVFSLQILEALVDATLFSRLLQRIQLDEVRAADIEGLEVCPFCDFAIILPSETSIFKCLNPECLKESCRLHGRVKTWNCNNLRLRADEDGVGSSLGDSLLTPGHLTCTYVIHPSRFEEREMISTKFDTRKCHRLSHIPQRCEELESDDQARARKFIEDEMTRALVRVCYKCKQSFIKTDGCNKMTCSCGAKMCYICRKPIVDYKHFNGPGGEEKDKCPLYSTDKLLHVDAVEAVAKKALEEVTSKHPELKLKHDPTKILPHADSAKTTLPPGVNEEAERLINLLQNLQQHNERIPRAHIQPRQNNNLPNVVNPQLPRMGRPHHQVMPAPLVIQPLANHRPQGQQNPRAVAGLINQARVNQHPQNNQQNMDLLARHIEDHHNHYRGLPPHQNHQTH